MKKFSLAIAVVVLAGCSSSNPTIQTGEDAEISFDGLHRVDNARFASSWADPDIDFSRYNKVMPGGAEYEFRAVRKTGQAGRARSSDTEFWISDEDRERLQEETSAIFAEELQNSTRFEVTDTRGDDVIIIRGALHDIVSRVPPDMVGRGEVYLSSVGEATLIIEVIDSMSNEVIFRAAERRAAEPGQGTMGMRSTSVSTWAEVRRLIRRWARTLREGLDSIPGADAPAAE
ncbi:MAG: DUF3313 family protein [Gammaproteobacteria bacterium]|jgi:hypothetical protein|nr:DUF3313 family protein [Gammaproteobacteria bacterium]